MMMLRLFVLVLSLFTPGLAFAPLQQTTTTTKLNAGMVLDSEMNAKYILAKAQECAFSDDNDNDVCSLTQAKEYLNDILEIQSGCVTGTLAGQSLCSLDHQDSVADIVAHLRQKVRNGTSSKKKTGTTNQQQPQGLESSTSTSNSNDSNDSLQLVQMTFLIGLAPSLLFLLGILWTTMDHGGAAAGAAAPPYTLQEWWWALQGGYVDQLISHYMRNFGI